MEMQPSGVEYDAIYYHLLTMDFIGLQSRTSISLVQLHCAAFFFWSITLNPFTPKSDLIDFTLSNPRRFYDSSKRDPLGVKGLKKLIRSEKKKVKLLLNA